jgi:release factor glutamine methyltransferase
MDAALQTLKSLYRNVLDTLNASGIEFAEIETRRIIKTRTAYDWGDIISKPETILDSDELDLIQSDVQQRLSGVPLSRIYGVREFWGLEFELSEDTLDPRPDTETIIEIAKNRFLNRQPESILDLGTGSGCILVSLLHEFQSSFGVGIDLSFNAVRTAQRNAIQNQVAPRAQFLCGNWADSVQGFFDLVVSNPPYIADAVIPTLGLEVLNHDPILALSGGDDGLKAYRKIFSSLKKLLKPSGIALFEIGYDQEKSILRLVEEYGFLVYGVHRDLAGQPRVVEISSGDK